MDLDVYIKLMDHFTSAVLRMDWHKEKELSYLTMDRITKGYLKITWQTMKKDSINLSTLTILVRSRTTCFTEMVVKKGSSLHSKDSTKMVRNISVD